MAAPLTRGETLIAALVVSLASIVAVGLATIEGYRLMRPESPIFREERPASLAQALTEGYGVEDAYPFIRAGQDPNTPVTVDDPELTGGGTLRASPLMLAVAAGHGNAVKMLLSFGAHLDLPENRLAVCLAGELGHEEVLGILADYDSSGDATPCPEVSSDTMAPLRRWVEHTAVVVE